MFSNNFLINIFKILSKFSMSRKLLKFSLFFYSFLTWKILKKHFKIFQRFSVLENFNMFPVGVYEIWRNWDKWQRPRKEDQDHRACEEGQEICVPGEYPCLIPYLKATGQTVYFQDHWSPLSCFE